MKLIDQLPPRIKQIKEIADFQDAVQPIIDRIDERCDQVLINRNPLYANLDGVRQWEEWLLITPDPSKTLEQRQLDIVAKLNERLPFTLVQLYRILASIVGWDALEIVTYPGEAKLDIEFNISERDATRSVGNLLKRIIPAHVDYKVRHIYNVKQENIGVFGAGRQRDIITIPINEERQKAIIKMNRPYRHKEIIEVKDNG